MWKAETLIGQFRNVTYHSDFAKVRRMWSAIDSITQNEDSKIDNYYVMMMRNNKFEHYGRDINFKQRSVELFFSSRFELWNLEYNTIHNHTIT